MNMIKFVGKIILALCLFFLLYFTEVYVMVIQPGYIFNLIPFQTSESLIYNLLASLVGMGTLLLLPAWIVYMLVFAIPKRIRNRKNRQ